MVFGWEIGASGCDRCSFCYIFVPLSRSSGKPPGRPDGQEYDSQSTWSSEPSERQVLAEDTARQGGYHFAGLVPGVQEPQLVIHVRRNMKRLEFSTSSF